MSKQELEHRCMAIIVYASVLPSDDEKCKKIMKLIHQGVRHLEGLLTHPDLIDNKLEVELDHGYMDEQDSLEPDQEYLDSIKGWKTENGSNEIEDRKT